MVGGPSCAPPQRVGERAGMVNATIRLRLTAVRLSYDHLIKVGLRQTVVWCDCEGERGVVSRTIVHVTEIGEELGVSVDVEHTRSAGHSKRNGWSKCRFSRSLSRSATQSHLH